MPIASVTRQHLRSARFLMPFFWHALRSRAQPKQTVGNLGVQVRKANGPAFWTLSLWQDAAAMRSFVIASPHKEAMLQLAHWCDEAAFAHWQSNSDRLPTWEIAADVLRTEGHLASVSYPSARHKAGEIVVS